MTSERVGWFAEIFECDPLDLPFTLTVLNEIDQDGVHEDHKVGIETSLETLIERERVEI